MRKTKIICTLGPSTDKDGVLRELVANGMNVARFNFSHGSYEEHKGRLDMLKAIRTELGKPVAALLDTKGPEIRLKEFKNGVEMLEAGQTFTLTTREVEGTKEICSITYKDLPQDVHEGGTIMLDDGLIKLAIKSVSDTDIVCEVLNSGKIKTKKGVNVPGVHLSMPYLSQRDRDDIIFGIQQGFDFIAASFVRTAQDVYDIRNLLNEYDCHTSASSPRSRTARASTTSTASSPLPTPSWSPAATWASRSTSPSCPASRRASSTAPSPSASPSSPPPRCWTA